MRGRRTPIQKSDSIQLQVYSKPTLSAATHCHYQVCLTKKTALIEYWLCCVGPWWEFLPLQWKQVPPCRCRRIYMFKTRPFHSTRRHSLHVVSSPDPLSRPFASSTVEVVGGAEWEDLHRRASERARNDETKSTCTMPAPLECSVKN